MSVTKKIIALLIAVLMTVPLAVSCKKDGKEENESSQTTVSTNQFDEETGREDSKDNLPDNLDFGGKEVKIFYGVYDPNFDNKAYEIEGNMENSQVSKAIYLRNLSVEDRLKIDIVFDQAEGTYEPIDYKKLVESLILSSADESIDIIYNRAKEAVEQSNAGYFREIGDFKYIDLNQNWWFKKQMENISLNKNRMYILMGDLLTSNYGNMTSMFFNKDLYNEIFSSSGAKADDLYEKVREGKWTWEEYFKIVADGYRDVDGNGEKNLGDVFGAHTETGNRTATYYPYTSGLQLSLRDAEGYPIINFNTPEVGEMIEDLHTFIYGNEGTFQMDYSGAESEFFKGNLMFYSYFLSRGTSIVANVDFNYGVLPFPKHDENKDYTTAVLTGAGVYVIPKYLSDDKLDVVGATIEALCSESYRSVTYEYYDTVLKVKQSGGENDADMIDIIRDHVKTDFTFWSGKSTSDSYMFFRRVVIDSRSKDYTSTWKQFGPMYESSLEKLIKDFKSIEDK